MRASVALMIFMIFFCLGSKSRRQGGVEKIIGRILFEVGEVKVLSQSFRRPHFFCLDFHLRFEWCGSCKLSNPESPWW